MEVVLLGTGGADGWPNPWCGCSSCSGMRAHGEVRGQTSALVDGTLLLDCGPETPRAAERSGLDLTRVRTVALTHAHPDHASGPPLLWRQWAAGPGPLEVLGPPAALEVLADWVGPDDPVTLRRVAPGDEVDATSGHRLRAVAARHGDASVGPAVLWDVRGADGARLLYATDTAPLPEETLDGLSGAAFDALLLECSFGDQPVPGQDHHGLHDWPLTVAALEQRGAMAPGALRVAVHLTHGNPPPPELDRRLAAWGAVAPPDGAVLHVGRHSPAATSSPAARAPHRTLLLGGARSGKSTEAERRLLAEPSVAYVATGGSREDADWVARVAAHRARRPPGWTTVETAALVDVLRDPPAPVLLVDCLTLWLTDVLDRARAWDDAPGWGEVVDADVAALLDAWDATPARVVAVGNEVGSGVHAPTRAGRVFADRAGALHAALAARSEEVALVVAGRVVPLTPAPDLRRAPGGVIGRSA